MITAEQIPDEVEEAAAKGLCLAQGYDWDRHPDFHPAWRKEARAAIAAALNAWPGMQQRPFWDLMTHARHVEIILPQEASDE